MQELMQLVQNYGVGTFCIVYIIYFQNTTMKEMLNTLKSIDKRLTVIETKNNIKKPTISEETE